MSLNVVVRNLIVVIRPEATDLVILGKCRPLDVTGRLISPLMNFAG